MSSTTPTYAIMRFAKYKGPEISRIEAHDERTKEKYASNPDVDISRSHLNFHLFEPTGKYRAMSEKRIAEVGCRTRSDSVRLVETLVTASPQFFEGKSDKEVRAFFEKAMRFFEEKIGKGNFISAVVHMDEKTPHMHFSFVPVTKDGRLCAKEIVGNRKDLVKWQDEFWEYMVKKYPELERGESASVTGRDHIPPRIFKQAKNIKKKWQHISALLGDINAFNAKRVSAELDAALRKFFPAVGKFLTETKKYDSAIRALKTENAELQTKLTDAKTESFDKLMSDAQLAADYANLKRVMDCIPPEIVFMYAGRNQNRGREESRGAKRKSSPKLINRLRSTAMRSTRPSPRRSGRRYSCGSSRSCCPLPI